jgi:hypothetical protein
MHFVKEIEYKGFIIAQQKAADGSCFYSIKNDGIRTVSYLITEKAAMRVIDTYLNSLQKIK